jgi:hypothetical protein
MSDHLIDAIKETRIQEIKDEKNACTYPPLYVVYDITETVCEHNTDYTQATTLFGIDDKYIRPLLDGEGEFIEAEGDTDKWDEEIEHTPEGEEDALTYRSVLKMSHHDRFVTVCFTREAAEQFIKLERHNLKDPRIYVHGIPRRNVQLVELGKLFGDKP